MPPPAPSNPMDYSARYNTVLSRVEEAAYQLWATQHGRANDVYDYDLRGAFKANAEQAVNGHLPDTYKKPNHPTFSEESIYNNVDGAIGGQWLTNPKTNRSTYKASPYVVKTHGKDALQDYFRKVEPQSFLVLP